MGKWSRACGECRRRKVRVRIIPRQYWRGAHGLLVISVMKLGRLARNAKDSGCLARIGLMVGLWYFERMLDHQLLNAAVLPDLYQL